ncbi:PqqD family protein [Hazenella coriacea]|uniref:PqqD family protein n=1 Tax=Hazenella coriacea TaxID=1179467 RepID=UPI001FB23883|nr:PqqD family protein [Hazenella coriacea]
MFSKKKSKQNIFDMIPVLKSEYILQPLPQAPEKLKILLPRKNWIEKLSIRFLKQPKYRTVHLDSLGSFVLKNCEGRYTVAELGEEIKKNFSGDAEPIFPRLIKFLEIVEANGWIYWIERSE